MDCGNQWWLMMLNQYRYRHFRCAFLFCPSFTSLSASIGTESSFSERWCIIVIRDINSGNSGRILISTWLQGCGARHWINTLITSVFFSYLRPSISIVRRWIVVTNDDWWCLTSTGTAIFVAPSYFVLLLQVCLPPLVLCQMPLNSSSIFHVYCV